MLVFLRLRTPVSMKIYLFVSVTALVSCKFCEATLNAVEELNTLKETIRKLDDRTDALQQIVEGLLHSKDMNSTSLPPETTDEPRSSKHSEDHTDDIGNMKRSYPSNLLMPSIIAFFAYMNGDEQTVNKHHLLIFNYALLNTGNGYHPTSGIFIAPQTGVYAFTWTVRIHMQSIVLIVNGSSYISTFNRPTIDSVSGMFSADESVTGFAIVYLNQGEDVYLRTHSTYDGDGGVFSNGFGRSTFGGWILH